MSLPEKIESQIAEYLNLEFGSNDITEGELEYVGTSNDIHYWILSHSKEKYWATVEPYEDSYLIGMTTSAPSLN